MAERHSPEYVKHLEHRIDFLERRLRLFKWFSGIAAGVFVLAICGVSAFALAQRTVAQHQAQVAVQQSQVAAMQARKAATQAQIAKQRESQMLLERDKAEQARDAEIRLRKRAENVANSQEQDGQ